MFRTRSSSEAFREFLHKLILRGIYLARGDVGDVDDIEDGDVDGVGVVRCDAVCLEPTSCIFCATIIVSRGAGLGSRLMSVSSVMITQLAGQLSDMAGITTHQPAFYLPPPPPT